MKEGTWNFQLDWRDAENTPSGIMPWSAGVLTKPALQLA